MGQKESIVKLEEGNVDDHSCMRSEPLDAYITYDALWKALTESLKTEFHRDPNVVEGKVSVFTEAFFEVERAYNGGHRFLSRYTCDAERGEVLEEFMILPFGLLIDVGVMRIHRSPVYMEAWRQGVGGHRGGPFVADEMKQFLKDFLERDEVTVACNVPSRLLPELLCSISEPLQSITNADDLYEAVLREVKSHEHDPFRKSAELEVIHECEDFEASYLHLVLDREQMKSRMNIESDTDPKVLHKVWASKKLMAITSLSMTENRNILEVSYTIIHKEPLLVERWKRNPRVEDPIRTDRPIFQESVNCCLEKAGVAPGVAP